MRSATARAAVRIQAGKWKGRKLEVPGGARPTSGRARAGLFNMLGPQRIAGARVLDLFAGSGAVGLEAVSRGASAAVLVESDAGALARTCERLGAGPEEVRVLPSEAGPALATLLREGERFDLVFADPPYRSGAAEILEAAGRLLGEGGVLVIQADEGAAVPPAASLRLVSRRAYGRNVFHFYEITGSRL